MQSLAFLLEVILIAATTMELLAEMKTAELKVDYCSLVHSFAENFFSEFPQGTQANFTGKCGKIVVKGHAEPP